MSSRAQGWARYEPPVTFDFPSRDACAKAAREVRGMLCLLGYGTTHVLLASLLGGDTLVLSRTGWAHDFYELAGKDTLPPDVWAAVVAAVHELGGTPRES